MRKVILTIVPLLIVLLLPSCFVQKTDDKKVGSVGTISSPNRNLPAVNTEELQSYTDKRFNFTVSFPKRWSGENSTTSIDGGIKIIINNDEQDTIWVYGCYGTVSFPEQGFMKETIHSDHDTPITLLSWMDENDRIHTCSALDKFHGVIIQCDRKSFEANKNDIYTVIKSIKINGQPVSLKDETRFTEAYNGNIISPAVTEVMREKLLNSINHMKEMLPGVGPWRIIYCNGERIVLYNYAHIVACDITETNKGIYSVIELNDLKVGSYQGGESAGVFPSPDGMACVIGTGCWGKDYKSTKSLYICNLSDSSVKELEENYNMIDTKVTWYRNMPSSTMLPWYVSIEGKDAAVIWDFEKSKKLNSIPAGVKEETVVGDYVEEIDFDTGYAYYFWWKKDENTVIGAPYRKGANSTGQLKLSDFEIIEINLKDITGKVLYKIWRQ